ncbi:MAG: glycoside hydrolase family 18 protein, partial [FCB group bacterium]|nr:glycoside hydrolase family 18 protein [FCB group bacterium]
MKNIFISFFIPLFSLTSLISAQDFDKNIVGYFVSWGVYVRDYHVPDIPVDKVNVINYAFANISNGQIALGDPYADIDMYYPGDCWDPGCLRGSFHQLQILKETNPHLKTLISVGGWTWSHYFSQVAATAESRALFAESCVEFVQQYGFDGVDIDWEYPVSGGLPGNIYSPDDRENFTLLLSELRGQLDAAGDYLLTIAAPASPLVIANIEVENIHPYLDWINIMSYDFHGPWGGDADVVTNFLSALYPLEEDPLEEPYHSQFNLSAAVETYLGFGVPAEKLNPGLPFYGRGFANVANENNGLF